MNLMVPVETSHHFDFTVIAPPLAEKFVHIVALSFYRSCTKYSNDIPIYSMLLDYPEIASLVEDFLWENWKEMLDDDGCTWNELSWQEQEEDSRQFCDGIDILSEMLCEDWEQVLRAYNLSFMKWETEELINSPVVSVW